MADFSGDERNTRVQTVLNLDNAWIVLYREEVSIWTNL